MPGPDLAVMLSRRVRAEVIPLPGRVARSQVPSQREVLRHRVRIFSEAVFGVAQFWIRPDPRSVPKTAGTSPVFPDPCPYRPGRIDDTDHLPTRIDEC